MFKGSNGRCGSPSFKSGEWAGLCGVRGIDPDQAARRWEGLRRYRWMERSPFRYLQNKITDWDKFDRIYLGRMGHVDIYYDRKCYRVSWSDQVLVDPVALIGGICDSQCPEIAAKMCDDIAGLPTREVVR